MRNRISLLRNVLFSFTIICVSVFSTSSSCTGPDERPPLSTRFPDKWDITLDQPYFSYDLSSFINGCVRFSGSYPTQDIETLREYHGMSAGSGILDFSSLLQNSDSQRRPEIKFVFSHPECSAPVTISYDRYDERLCAHNTITDVPKINSPHIVEFSARTVKTVNNVYVKWFKEYAVTGVGSYLKIDLPGSTEFPSYMYTKSTGGGSNRVAARPNSDFQAQVIYEPLVNTLPYDLCPGLYDVTVTEESLVSTTLVQGICISGRLDKSLKWDAPVVLELNNKTPRL